MNFRCVSKWLEKKIKSLLFAAIAMTLVGAIGYYIGSSNQEESSDLQLVSNPMTEIKRIPSTKKNIVEEMGQEQIAASLTSLTASKQTEGGLEHQKQKASEHYASKVRESNQSVSLSKISTQRTQTGSQELRPIKASNSFVMSKFTPQKHLDKQLEDLQNYFKVQEKNLRERRLPPEQHNILIARMQADYDAKKYALEQAKRQLETIKKLINTGAITPEAGNEAMWRLVLPERTHEALFQKPTQPEIGQ